MPSPLGHAIGGVVAGWLAEGRPAARSRLARAAAIAAIAMAPDLDLLIGRHRAETHSVGAAVIVASLAAAMRWPLARTRVRIWLVVAAAWGSHVLLDALGGDSSPPVGLMAFWPFSPEFVKFPVDVFLPMSRRWRVPGFTTHTLVAVSRELILLSPPLAIVWWWKRRQG